MPKLSQQTLQKRFQCPYCSVTVRTRQGVSGHIQFKHAMNTMGGTEKKSYLEEAAEVKVKEMLASSSQKSTDAELQNKAEIDAEWYFFKASMKVLMREKIKFNDADYKTYLLVATAVRYGNQRLMDKLGKEFTQAITQLMEISAKMATKS